MAKTASGATTRYLVDDLNPTGYAQVVEETGGSQREYTYGLQRIDEGQTVSNAWTLSYYGYDGLGTVRQLTNSAGMVTDTYEYDAFGNEITSTGTTPNNYLYRGEQYDPDLGLYYLRARYYNPLTGRFMSRDPEDGNQFDPKSFHKYLYADGDPINGIDPRGMDDLVEYRWLVPAAIATTATILYIQEGDKWSLKKWLDDYLSPPPPPAEPSSPKCEQQYENDMDTCRGLDFPGARSRCYESALNRKNRCEQGWEPLPL